MTNTKAVLLPLTQYSEKTDVVEWNTHSFKLSGKMIWVPAADLHASLTLRQTNISRKGTTHGFEMAWEHGWGRDVVSDRAEYR